MSERLDRLRDVTAAKGADAALITHPANRHYFTGYPAEDHAPDESSGVLLVTPDAAILYASPTNLPWASASARPPVRAAAWERPWQAFLAKQITEFGVRRLLFEDRAMIVADHAAIVTEAEGLEYVPAGDTIHQLRAIKDDSERAAIAEAARITDEALRLATENLRPGITERELAWTIERAMRECGADGAAFATCVAAGPHGARPHHAPTDRPLEAGEPIVIDLGAKVNGYCGDLTRTIILGEPTVTFTDRYNTVLAAQCAALVGTHAGMTGRESDALAREMLAAAGFDKEFIHGLGHGVGLLIHEGPSLGPKTEETLLPGHVVTIEPGIYFEGWGGIRIEDLCVITPNGLEVLSHAPK